MKVLRNFQPSKSSYLVVGLLVYLLLFSSFALFHAYHDNELVDAQGCEIGLWLQHSQGTLSADLGLLALTLLISLLIPLRQSIFLFLGPLNTLSRSPPVFSTI